MWSGASCKDGFMRYACLQYMQTRMTVKVRLIGEALLSAMAGCKSHTWYTLSPFHTAHTPGLWGAPSIRLTGKAQLHPHCARQPGVHWLVNITETTAPLYHIVFVLVVSFTVWKVLGFAQRWFCKPSVCIQLFTRSELNGIRIWPPSKETRQQSKHWVLEYAHSCTSISKHWNKC